MNKKLLQSETDLLQINTPEGRFYRKGNKLYASVTSIISATSDKTGIQNWKNRIGKEEAQKIISESAANGTDLHKALTEWLEGEEITSASVFTKTRMTPIQTFLTKEIKILIGCDTMLCSDVLMIAGTFDLLYVNHSSELVLCDFKTAKNERKEEWLTNYYDQVAMYSMMFEEQHKKLMIEKGLLLFSYGDMTIEPFYFNPHQYYARVQERITAYRQM